MHIFGLGTAQNVSCNAAGGASTQSTALSQSAEAVLVSCTTNDVRIAIGSNPTADANSTLLPKPFAVVLKCNPGDKVAVLGNDVTTGSVSVTEIAGDGPA